MAWEAVSGLTWKVLLEASVFALGERGTAAFALVMTLCCGLAAVVAFAKSARKIVEIVWNVLGLALTAFVTIALLNAFAPAFYPTMGRLLDVAMGRAGLQL